MTTIVHPDPEVAATLLRANPDYRVLRRFVPRDRYGEADLALKAGVKVGLYVDVETTGLDTATDQIIELGLVPFEFDHCGNIYSVGAGFNFFNDPGIPIPPEVTALTGITDADVKGKTIDHAIVSLALEEAVLVVAHNADFDRKMIERPLPGFINRAWACSYREVGWERFGCAGGKLQYVIQGACGEFYEAHRAIDDCRAGVHVLAAAQLDGRTALSYLLDSARLPTLRVWAQGAPFGMKEALKKRGYRWHDGATGRSKCWYRDSTHDEIDAEMRWLNDRLVRGQVDRFTALDRYSVRAG